MILVTTSIILFILNLITPLINLLPDISLSLHGGVAQTFLDWIALACYMLPMRTVSIITTLIIDILVIRIIIAAIRALWGILPIV